MNKLELNLKDPNIQFLMGASYLGGDYIKKNEEEAVKWLTKAADQNHIRALNFLASCYEEGVGVNEDLSKAAELYLRGATLGNCDCQADLGFAYLEGLGVDQDYVEAVKWLTKAADQGNLFAKYTVGDCYYYGLGVVQNYKLAAKYYKDAENEQISD